MTTQPCPACAEPVLVVRGSRLGGQMEAFDPEPGQGAHYDTLLDPDLTYVGRRLLGGGVLYRSHRWTCPQGLRVPSRDRLPGWAGYTHK